MPARQGVHALHEDAPAYPFAACSGIRSSKKACFPWAGVRWHIEFFR